MPVTIEQAETELRRRRATDELARRKTSDFGIIALPREKLPGVWDYDRQLDDLLGDPDVDIENFIPLDVRYDFGRVTGMTEKPDETKDRMATSLFYSVELGIPPSVSFSILDELNRIAFDETIPASTAWGRIKQRYRTGKAQVQLMDMGYDILRGTWQDWEAYDRNLTNIEKLQSGMTIDQRKEFRNFFEKLVGASAELAPFGLEAAKEFPAGAAIGGTMFGIGAALATGAIPTIGEEVAVVPAIVAGMKVGAGIKGAIRVGELEAGGMFLELAQMKDQYGNKIDPRIAVVASHAVGTINGGIELAEWQVLLSTFGLGKKLFDKSVRKVTHRLFTQGTIKELIARKALDYSIALGAETLQEIEQETTTIVFGELAKELNNARKGTDFKPITAEALETRYREVTVESMRAFGLMVLPGTTVSGALELVAQKKAEAAVKKVEKPAEVKVPPEITALTDDALYEKFRATKITEPEWKPLYEEVVRRKEAETPPTEAITAPEPTLTVRKPAEVAEIPPKAVEAVEVLSEAEKAKVELKAKIAPIEAKAPEEIAKSFGVPIKVIPKGLRAKAQYRKRTDDIAIRSHLPKGFDKDAAIAHELGHRAHTNIGNDDMDVFNKLVEEFRQDINKNVGRNITYFEEKGDYHGYFEAFAELYGRYILGKELPNNQFKFYFDEVVPLPPKALLAQPPAEAKAKYKVGTDIWYTHKGKTISARIVDAKPMPATDTMKADYLYVISPFESPKKTISVYQSQAEIEAQPTEAKAEPTKVEVKPTEIAEAKVGPIRQKIHAIAAVKGLTKKALSELKKKHTGYRRLTGKVASKKITTEQLQNLLKAVQKARPKRVGYKRVITRKTEKKIQTLKKNLIVANQMSEKAYKEILQKETQGKEPAYVDARNFVTQSQGQAVIERLLNEAEIQKVILPRKNAVDKNKSISEAYAKIKRTGEIKDPCRLRSMRFYVQRLAYKATAPIYDVYLSIIDSNNQLERQRAKIKQHIMEMPDYNDIVKSESAMQRISDYIAAKSYLKDKPVSPKDITSQEESIANYIENTLKKWRWKARVAKFFEVEGRYTEIPQYEVPQHRESIKKTVEILETKGTDAAIDYMKTQNWGVIRSGFEPLENITLRIRSFVMPAKAMAKGHIKPRTQIEYMQQERNIFQRFDSYLRQIDNLSVLKPKINAFVGLVEDNLGKFDNPQDVRASIEVFLLNLKHINPSGNGLIEKVIRMLYGQALTTRVLGDPLKIVRNYPTQNLVFEQDKSTLFDSRNKPLTAEDMEYFTTNIEQSNPLMREWAFAGEKPLPIPIAKQLTQFIRKYTLYPWSDTKNRLMSDTAKINQVRRAVDEARGDIDRMMKLAKYSDYEVAEQRMALGILALEGSDSMSRYIARCHVENTHYLYDTKQRSPAEQTVTGKLVLNLFLFRRASLEKLFRNIAKAADKKAQPQQRLRATKVVSVLLVSSFVMGLIWKRLTGQRRTPYDYIGFMEFQPGGLMWGAVESFSEAYNSLLNAARGDTKALEFMAVSIPRCSDLLLPFYKQSLDALEATIGAKNLDRKAIRMLRELIDNEYKIRGGAYKVEREWYEAIQYAIAGAGVDVKEEKKKTARKGIKRSE